MFWGSLMAEDELSFLQLTECVQNSALWRESHCAYNAVKTWTSNPASQVRAWIPRTRRYPGVVLCGGTGRMQNTGGQSSWAWPISPHFQSALPIFRLFSVAQSRHLLARVSLRSRPDVRRTPLCARCTGGLLPWSGSTRSLSCTLWS